MHNDRESSGGAGIVIAAVLVVVVLLVCGGGALAAAGFLFFRMSAAPMAMPPPAQVTSSGPAQAHADIVSIAADGSLLWNDAPVSAAELRQRLDELKNATGPPRSVILRQDPAAPPAARDEIVQLLADRQVSYIVED